VTHCCIARTATLFGGGAALEAALSQAGYARGAPAGLLLNAEPAPSLDAVAARCFAFADALPASEEGLIVTLVHPAGRGLANWQAGAAAAALLSFTRDAALSWGPRRIRVNMIQVHPHVPDDDVAASLLTMIRLASMTGQMITLGAPPSGACKPGSA
jgi:NAD(P)-dependent dehydrogenase (short-subunit alcohol dehydrogenase family)